MVRWAALGRYAYILWASKSLLVVQSEGGGIESRRLVGRGDRHREAMATLAVPTAPQTGGGSEAKLVTRPRGENPGKKKKGI